MPRSPRRARIAPGLYVEKITINVPIVGIPVVEISGRARTGNPRIDAVSNVTVVTTALPPSGERFIGEMTAQFSDAGRVAKGKD